MVSFLWIVNQHRSFHSSICSQWLHHCFEFTTAWNMSDLTTYIRWTEKNVSFSRQILILIFSTKIQMRNFRVKWGVCVAPWISGTPWPMSVKFCMRDLSFIWKISTGKIPSNRFCFQFPPIFTTKNFSMLFKNNYDFFRDFFAISFTGFCRHLREFLKH